MQRDRDLPGIVDSLREIQATYKTKMDQRKSFTDKLDLLVKKKELLLKAQGVLDTTIQQVSEGGIQTIESLVSEGLELVFRGEGVEFKVDKKTGAKGNSYQLLISKGGVTGPAIDTFGGGIVNVTQLLIRVIMIQRFGLKKILVLDESFNNVSIEYLPRVSEMLRTLCSDQGFDVLMITHQPILTGSADQVYSVSKSSNGPSLRLLESYELDGLRGGEGEDRGRGQGEAQGADPQGQETLV